MSKKTCPKCGKAALVPIKHLVTGRVYKYACPKCRYWEHIEPKEEKGE